MKLKKIKPLLPSLREKKRYLAFEVIAKDNLNANSFENAFKKASHDFLGTLGCAQAGAIVLKDKWKHNKGLIRVNNKCVPQVKSSLMMIEEIAGTDVIVRSLGVSGVLQKAVERYIQTKED